MSKCSEAVPIYNISFSSFCWSLKNIIRYVPCLMGWVVSFRRKVEGMNEALVRKCSEKSDLVISLEQKCSECGEKALQLKEKVATWENILKVIVNPDTHGSKKEPHMTWIEFFQEKTDSIIHDAPINFSAKELSFENAIVLVSTHIGTLRKETEAIEKNWGNMKKRVEKRQATHEAQLQKVKKGW